MVPEIDVERVRRWAAVRVPVALQDELRMEVEVDPLSITLVERRMPWREDDTEWSRLPIARFRYTKKRNEWTLYCYRGNGNQERYPFAPSTPHVTDLLDAVDRDETSIFWG